MPKHRENVVFCWDTAPDASASQHLWFSGWLQAVCEGLELCEGLEIPFENGDQASVYSKGRKSCGPRSCDTSWQQPPAKGPQILQWQLQKSHPDSLRDSLRWYLAQARQRQVKGQSCGHTIIPTDGLHPSALAAEQTMLAAEGWRGS